jgi:hypothetical protein
VWITHGFAACSVALPLESGECSAAAARNTLYNAVTV